MSEWLIESRCAGTIKRILYSLLRLLFKFGSWHVVPINQRPYALEIYRTLNNYIEKIKLHYVPIVEVGCGLGDIIGSLRWKYGKIGYDLSLNVLKGAELLHPDVIFHQGTFENVNCKNIRYLIMVNFIHVIPPDKLKKSIEQILDKNKVEMFVLDTFRNNEGTEYIYSHDGNYLFNGRYKRIKRSKEFIVAHGAKRYIEYWKIK